MQYVKPWRSQDLLAITQEVYLLDMGYTNWMSYFPNNYLSELSIPGSHDSAAYNSELPTWLGKVVPNIGLVAVTQAGPVLDQLNSGVRFLDLRVRSVGSNLYAYHGGTPQVKLDTVLQSINHFLTSNPTEGVIVSLQEDDGLNLTSTEVSLLCALTLTTSCDLNNDRIDLNPTGATGVDSDDKQYLEKRGPSSWVLNPSDGNLNSNLNSYLENYAPPSGYYTSNNIPRASEIQQKVLLITPQSDIKNGVNKVAIDWSGANPDKSLDDGASLYVQNNWTQQPDAKYHNVHDTMYAANSDSDMQRLYLNWTNTTASSGTPLPPKVSSGLINPRLMKTLSSPPRWYKLGVVAYNFITNPFNFPRSELAWQTILSNKDYSSDSEDQLLENSSDELTAKTPPASTPEIRHSRRRPDKLIMKYSDEQDKIIGTNLSERIRARKGNDFINSGSGDDIINGGKGIDSFVLSKGNNIIKDFKAGEFLLVDNDRFDDVKLIQKGDDLLVKVKNHSSTLLLDQELKDFDASCIIPASVATLF